MQKKKILPEHVWSEDGYICVRTVQPSSIIRVYSASGALLHQQTLLAAGETKFKLPTGVYIVTINSGAGYKVRVGKS